MNNFKKMKSYKIILFCSFMTLFSTTAAHGINETETEQLFEEAALHVQLFQYNTALVNLEKILESYPNNTSALNNKGEILIKQKKYVEAANIFSKILEIDPGNEIALKHGATARNNLKLESVVGSKYQIFMQVQVHDKNGKLVGVIETNHARYFPHSITDEFVDTYPVTEIVEINNIMYEKRNITVKYSSEHPFLIQSGFTQPIFGIPTPVISAMYHTIPIKNDYDITSISTILRQIS